MTKTVIPVIHMFNDEYVIPAAVAFLSMLSYASKDYRYKLYVMHTDITKSHQKLLAEIVSRFDNADLEYIDMHNRMDNIYINPAYKGRYTKEIFYKLLLPSIFPQYDKVILTDVDVVYQGDISKSWQLVEQNDDFYLAGVKGIRPKKDSWLNNYQAEYDKEFSADEKKALTVGAGYLIYNLKNMRKDNLETVFLDYLKQNAHKLIQPEQDVLNISCPNNKKVYLPLENTVCTYVYELYKDVSLCDDFNYSTQEIANALTFPIQIHYAGGIKPWNAPISTKSDIWFQWLAQTPFFYDLMNNFVKNPSNEQEYYRLWGKFDCVTINTIKGKGRLFKIFKLKKHNKEVK